LLPAGATLPLTQGQPPIVDGEPSTLTREIAAGDAVLVKVRWKDIGATDADPAHEGASSLPGPSLGADLARADDDPRWATSIAALAEILKKSPFADPAFLPEIDRTVAAQSARDTDRAELATLLARVRAQLPAR